MLWLVTCVFMLKNRSNPTFSFNCTVSAWHATRFRCTCRRRGTASRRGNTRLCVPTRRGQNKQRWCSTESHPSSDVHPTLPALRYYKRYDVNKDLSRPWDVCFVLYLDVSVLATVLDAFGDGCCETYRSHVYALRRRGGTCQTIERLLHRATGLRDLRDFIVQYTMQLLFKVSIDVEGDEVFPYMDENRNKGRGCQTGERFERLYDMRKALIKCVNGCGGWCISVRTGSMHIYLHGLSNKFS